MRVFCMIPFLSYMNTKTMTEIGGKKTLLAFLKTLCEHLHQLFNWPTWSKNSAVIVFHLDSAWATCSKKYLKDCRCFSLIAVSPLVFRETAGAFILCLLFFRVVCLTVSSLESLLWVKISRCSLDPQLSPFSLLSWCLQADSMKHNRENVLWELMQSIVFL